MFDQLSALRKAKQMQDQIKKSMESIFHQEESGDSLVLIRGDKRIEKIVIDGEERKDIKELLNDAGKNLDKKLEKEMKGQTQDLMDMMGLK